MDLHWIGQLGKEAAAITRRSTSRSRTVPMNTEEGKAQAMDALRAEPGNTAQAPARYGRLMAKAKLLEP